MASSENVITTHGLTKRYGQSITAVDALDLEVHRGEVFGFLGPTGRERQPPCGCCWG
jgi:ABC-2 type transport system ATP-binding protein